MRLDSGDLGELARQSRNILDDAGMRDTQIVASGGLDEYRIHELVAGGTPIDAFGVGSGLTTSSDYPALDIVYKLVDYHGRAVAKFSGVKSTWPGRKQVFRPDDDPSSDVLSLRDADEPGRPLLEPVWRDGTALRGFDVGDARERAAAELDLLPDAWQLPPYPEEAPLPAIGAALASEAERVRDAAFA